MVDSTTADLEIKPSSASLHRKLIISLVCVVGGFAPLLAAHFYELWSHTQYQYFPFVIAAVAYLAWNRSSEAAIVERNLSPFFVAALVLFSWILLAIGVAMYDGWLGMTSFIIGAAAVLYAVSARKRIVNLFGIWALLWLVVPLPFDLDTSLIRYLQNLSSRLSSAILDLVRVNHLMAQNVLELPSKQLFVDEACSGIVSVMSVIACAAIYAVWRNRSLFHSLLLIGAGVCSAVALNVARIVAIAVAEARWSWDLSEGTPHEVLGLVLFTITFIAMLSTDQFLCFVLAPISNASSMTSDNSLVKLWNYFTDLFRPGTGEPLEQSEAEVSAPAKQYALPVGLAFGALGVVHLGLWGFVSSPAYATIERIDASESNILPEQIDGWTKRQFEQVHRTENQEYGEFSRLFRYQHSSGIAAIVSVDYPFRGSWHELSYCYFASGWGKADRNVIAATDNGNEWNYVTADYTRQDGRNAYLAYSIFDASGQTVSPPTEPLREKVWRRLRRRGPSSTWPVMLQTQVFVESAKEITENQKEAIIDLFLKSRSYIHTGLIESNESQQLE
ncbi:MAG: exosortase U [Planctomycetales bacterium]|nr:exosortase U [Planctomycetales bacterium]